MCINMHTLCLCPSALRSTIAFLSLPFHCCAQSCLAFARLSVHSFAPANLSWHSVFSIAAAFLSPPCCAAADLAIVHRLAFAGTANVLFSESPCLSDSSQLSCSPCHCHPFTCSPCLCRSLPRFPLRRVRVPAFDSVPLLCASVRCLCRSSPSSSLPMYCNPLPSLFGAFPRPCRAVIAFFARALLCSSVACHRHAFTFLCATSAKHPSWLVGFPCLS